MNKKLCLTFITGLLAGGVIGYAIEKIHTANQLAGVYASRNLLYLGESEKRAFQAYRHESTPVGIYALTESLDMQNEASQIGETPTISTQMISADLILTHARLGKLYAKMGQTNLSAEHIQQALDYAKASSHFGITNQDVLMDFVAKVDNGAK